MASAPDLFDNEDEPDTESDAAPDNEPDTEAERSTTDKRHPNYLIRRAIVVGGVVAVIAIASIVVGQLIGSGATSTGSGAIDAEWNQIVIIDDRTGNVILDDGTGEEQGRIESGLQNVTDAAVINSTAVVTSADAVAIVDIGTESVERFDIGADRIVEPAGSALTMVAAASDGSRAVLAHGPSGDVIDTATVEGVVGARYEFAEARTDPSGRDILVTDSGNFQSVLFSFDRDTASFFPGLALAVDDTRVVTAQNVGNAATINVFDHDGGSLATGTAPSVRAGMISDAGIVLIAADGRVITMSDSTGDTTEGAQLDIGTVDSGDVTTNGDRLVISGSTGTAIVANDSEVVGTFDGLRPTGDAGAPTGSKCITLQSPDGRGPVSVIDTSDAAVVVEADGSGALLHDATGCVVAASTTSGFDVLSAVGVQQFQTGDILTGLSPDGRAVIVERAGRSNLLDIGDAQAAASSDPIDLGPRGRRTSFTNA